MRVARASAVKWARLVAAIVGTGVLAGLVGILMVGTLRAVEWLAFGRGAEYMMDAVRGIPTWRRFLAVPIGAGIAGVVWWRLRRRRRVMDIRGALSHEDADFPVVRTSVDALLQVLVVGSGSSVGRENAPRQMAAALANKLCRILRIEWRERRILIAAGAGAGLAAVYNTPLAAIPFALTILAGEWTVRGVATCAVVSAIATPIAWLATGGQPSIRLHVTGGTVAPVYMWALLAIPVCALAGWTFDKLAQRARSRARLEGATWRTPVAMLAVGCVTGGIGIALPQILGNGKSTMDVLFGDTQPIEPIVWSTMIAIAVIKPLATALTLRSGVVGGLLMPSGATGAGLGAAAALLVSAGAPGTWGMRESDMVALFALVAAVGVLAVTQASPLFATVFFIELTHAAAWIWPALAVTAFGSYWLVRWSIQLRWRHRE